MHDTWAADVLSAVFRGDNTCAGYGDRGLFCPAFSNSGGWRERLTIQQRCLGTSAPLITGTSAMCTVSPGGQALFISFFFFF